jgi:putative ubiquitin-RnfH superfamily antitoxin RatB of RatAB toxin-antitoxin module
VGEVPAALGAVIELEAFAQRDGVLFHLNWIMPAGSTIKEALAELVKRGFEPAVKLQRVDATQLPIEVGVWGQRLALNYVLTNFDRIEFYEPLTLEPKAARLARVKKERLAQGQTTWSRTKPQVQIKSD